MKKIYGYLILFVVAFLGNVSINHAQIQTDCPNPLDIHIANDISGSVSSIEHQQSKDFITQLGLSVPLGTGANESRIGISEWSFGSGRFVEYTFPGAGATFTTSQADIISYVSSARPFRGGTDVYTALLRAYEWVKQDRAGIRTGTPVIVLLTDALCNQIANNISSLATQIKNEGILIQVLAIDDAVNCTALQGTNVASPGGYFSAVDYAELQSDALFYITSLISNSCGTPPPTPVPDLTLNLSGFQINGCDTTPVANVDYTVTNFGRGDFSGTLDVSFYNGDPTLPSTQYLFTESSSQSLTAFGGSTPTLNSTNVDLLDTGELYAVVNIDGSLPANAVPLSANFTGVSLTDTTEENTANNTSSAITRADAGTCVPYAIIQTSVTNSGQICDNEAIYYVEVCNIGNADATVTEIIPYPDLSFSIVNGPVLVGNDPFIGTTLPQGECVIYEYTYNLDNAVASTSYDFSVDVKMGFTGPCAGEPSQLTLNGLVYKPVESNGQCWLDRNLGSPKVADNATDAAAYGDMYQWGRSADGHESRSSTIYDGAANGYPSTATASGAWDGQFIISSNGTTTNTDDDDWLASPNSTLWQSPGQTNNPCPSGWRVPTRTEWNTQVTSWGSGNNNLPGSYANSPLNLTLGGQRKGSVSQNGVINSDGTIGRYYTSTPEGSIEDLARIFTIFSSSANTFGQAQRADAYSIRCIKN